MDVSVIIVNYNTLKMTKDCIDSVIEKTKDVEYEIILVDNGSTDGSFEYFIKDNRIKYVYNKKNIGFGSANNLGYKYSSGKYIFLLNSDTILLNNAIKIFFNKMENLSDNIACCGTWLIDSDKNVIHSGGNFPKWYPSFFKNKQIEEYCRTTNDLIVDYVTGADLFIRRTVIEKYGMFDENFFLYFEETDMQERYNKHGLYSMIINGPQIIHLVGKSSKPSIAKGNLMLSSKIYYFKKRLNPIFFGVWKSAIMTKRKITLFFKY